MNQPIKHLPYQIDSRDRFGFYENYWKQVDLRLLLRHGPAQNRTVLDYGSGRGEALDYFKAAGFRVTGADVDPECVRLSSRFGEAVGLSVFFGPDNGWISSGRHRA